MARFIGRVQGNKQEVTRLGSAGSGLRVEANGWDSGVKVYADIDVNDEDEFLIVATGGSNGRREQKTIGRVRGGRIYLDREVVENATLY